MSKANNINLTILNKLVESLREQLSICNELPIETTKEDRVVSYSKLMGLCSGVSLEATGLVSDVMAIIKENSVPESNVIDILSSLSKSAVKN